MSEVRSELSVLAAVPETYTLESGVEVKVVDLKTRQFFRLLRIMTRGGGAALANLDLNPNQDPQGFAVKLAVTVLLAIPEAEQETIDFLCSMVEPVGLKEGKKLTKDEEAANDDLWKKVGLELAENPELGDTLGLIELIVKREAEDIQALGKKVMSMFSLAQKTNQLPTPEVVENSNQTPEESVSLV